MADHVREQVAVAVVAALTGLTTTGSRVYRDRDTDARPLQSSELPGLTIDDDGDPAEIVSLGRDGLLERTMTIRVTAHVKSASGYSSALNQILKEIEIALDGASLGGAKFAHVATVEGREKSEAADLPTVRQAFLIELPYLTQHGVPDVAF